MYQDFSEILKRYLFPSVWTNCTKLVQGQFIQYQYPCNKKNSPDPDQRIHIHKSGDPDPYQDPGLISEG